MSPYLDIRAMSTSVDMRICRRASTCCSLRRRRPDAPRRTKATTRGERCDGLDVTLAHANADTGRWRGRDSHPVGSVGTSLLAPLTCGNATDGFARLGLNRPNALTASTGAGDLGVVTRPCHPIGVPRAGDAKPPNRVQRRTGPRGRRGQAVAESKSPCLLYTSPS